MTTSQSASWSESCTDPKTGNAMQAILTECFEKRIQMIEQLGLAFMAKTKLDPEEIELVEETRGMEIVWYYRKREFPK